MSGSAFEVLAAAATEAFEAAVDDTVTLARANAAKHSRTGKFAASITRTPATREGDRLSASVGSPLSSARVKERGGFMNQTKNQHGERGGFMQFQIGTRWVTVEAFRVAATPAVRPAGARFPTLMTARLRELGLAGKGRNNGGRTGDRRSGATTVWRGSRWDTRKP